MPGPQTPLTSPVFFVQKSGCTTCACTCSIFHELYLVLCTRKVLYITVTVMELACESVARVARAQLKDN